MYMYFGSYFSNEVNERTSIIFRCFESVWHTVHVYDTIKNEKIIEKYFKISKILCLWIYVRSKITKESD